MESAQILVASRSCGSCNICCVALTIDEPELRKAQGLRCKHTKSDNGCSIYEARPKTCRDFYCGWRQLAWIQESLRPDISGILIRPHKRLSPKPSSRVGIAITLLTNKSIDADGLAETVATAVKNLIPLFLHIPGPPGFTSAIAQINQALAGPVAARDKLAILKVLSEGKVQADRGPFRRIVLEAELNGGSK